MKSSVHSFRRTFGWVLLAHMGVAAVPLMWGKLSAPRAWTASGAIPPPEIHWLDPAMPLTLATIPVPPELSAIEESPSKPQRQAAVKPVVKKGLDSHPAGRVEKSPVSKSKPTPPQPVRFQPKTMEQVWENPLPAVISPEPSVEAAAPSTAAILSAAAEDALRSYHERIQQVLESHWQQPAHASRDEVSVAKVALTISRGGQVSGVRLAASSGSNEVDRSALAAAHAVPQIDPLPSALNCDSYQILIRFVLH